MRAKLRQFKQELHRRMHDPIADTGRWLRSVVQGYFNYDAVPGNLDNLAVFRDRLLGLWRHRLRRRSQKHARKYGVGVSEESAPAKRRLIDNAVQEYLDENQNIPQRRDPFRLRFGVAEFH